MKNRRVREGADTARGKAIWIANCTGSDRVTLVMGEVEVQPQAAKTQSIQHLDESTFQQILRAAYVIQRQKDLQRRPLTSEPASNLALIADTQELLRSRRYEVSAAAELIIERLGRIVNAKGTAIALISNDEMTYCAAAGSLSSLSNHSGPVANDVSDFLREEESLHRGANDVRSELQGSRDDAPVFFPIYTDGRIAAVVQLVFAKSEAISKDQIQTCQLMAGLMGEVLSRAAELQWKQSLENERASMLKALERLQPHLERLAAEPTPQSSPNLIVTKSAESEETPSAAISEQLPELALADTLGEAEIPKLLEELLNSTCQNCGAPFREGAKFCGKCGEPVAEKADHSDLSGKEIGTTEEMPQPTFDLDHESALSSVVSQMPTFSASPATDGSTALAVASQVAEAEDHEDENRLQLVPQSDALDKASPTPFSSAAKAREWLQSLQPNQPGWLAKHSGDISIITAALVLILVAVGSSSRPAASKIASNKVPAQPSMSLLDRLLVGLGVAEAPAAPAHLGNPNVAVWEDLHTGLYYCPGADLYGKTVGGKVTNQRDAQLDQFEPAARRACD